MPIHLHDMDVVSKVAGLSSALIVPCNMCPAVTVAVREEKPFLKLFKSFLKSSPFECYIKYLQHNLSQHGVKTHVFKSSLYHQWFMCMWTSRRRMKLKRWSKDYEAVIVLGCNFATETVREAVNQSDCKVIEGMEVTGVMNARLSFNPLGEVLFKDCKVFPISQQKQA